MKKGSRNTSHGFGADIVITTGCHLSGWESVLPVLQQLGLEDTREVLAPWYDQFFQEVGMSDMLQVRHPFHPDEKSTEAIIALTKENVRLPLFWSEGRSLWILDFLCATFPSAKFMLFYNCVETALAGALEKGVDPESFLDGWYAGSQELIRFQRQNRSRALLLSAEAASHNPEAVSAACQYIGLEFQYGDVLPVATAAVPMFERLLAREFLRAKPLMLRLQMKIDASAQPLGETVHPYALPSKELYSCYQEAQLAVGQHAQVLQAQEKMVSSLSADLAQSKNVQDGLIESKSEIQQENQLLLLQLHQVQEELDHYFPKYQKLIQVIDRRVSEETQLQEKSGRAKAVLGYVLLRPLWQAMKQRRNQKRELKIINMSGLVDDDWYLTKYPDVAESGLEPALHYLCFGALEGRNPSVKFDTVYYENSNPDVVLSKMNPLLHYALYGQAEGRLPLKQEHSNDILSQIASD